MNEYSKKNDKGIQQIEIFDAIQEKLADYFNSIYSFTIKREDIFDSLFLLLGDKYNLEWPGDLWDVEIEYEEAFDLLNNFNFNTIKNTISIDENILPNDFIISYKVKIKSKNLIWIIHKNDFDPLPSNPHAHQLENNIKLDLSNGKCYQRKKYISKIRKKDLLKIREKAKGKMEMNLPELMI